MAGGRSRGAWGRDGEVVLRDVCTSGFDVHVSCREDLATFRFRWRPPRQTHAASRVLRSRFHLLVRAAMLQYPALWWAGRRGVAPMHAPACDVGGCSLLLVGPSGVGKTTLIAGAVAEGATAVGDNLAASDGHTVWGVVEPLRVTGGGGRKMAHGRGEMPLRNRVDHLVPDRLVVVRRGAPGSGIHVQPLGGSEAVRALVTSTYEAGELRRFWPLAAQLAAGTGLGPAHPPVEAVSEALASRLPAVLVELGTLDGVRLQDLAPASSLVGAPVEVSYP